MTHRENSFHLHFLSLITGALPTLTMHFLLYDFRYMMTKLPSEAITNYS